MNIKLELDNMMNYLEGIENKEYSIALEEESELMIINILEKINRKNVDDYIHYVIDNIHGVEGLKKKFLNRLHTKIQYTLIKGA